VVNGWTLTFHSFDYNLDHLGLGTIDDPAWKMTDRQASYLGRALAARGGLWGNHGYEAAYPMTYTDADGDRTPGLRRGSDGSLTIVIQHEPPADTSNCCRPSRPVPAHHAPVPAEGRRARRQLPDTPIRKAAG
jgi:hypothetical protein